MTNKKEEEKVLLRVIEDGEGEETIVFVHGWPDNYHTFDKQIAHFSKNYRCIRLVMPFYGDSKDEGGAISGNRKRYNRWGYNFESIGNMIGDTIQSVCGPRALVTVVAHDWGVHWASYFQKQHPEMVKKIVLLDVECPTFRRPPFRMFPALILMGVYYQWWLILAWMLLAFPLIGKFLANFFFRWTVGRLRHSAKGKDPLPQDEISELTPLCGFPYFYFQTNTILEALFLRSPLGHSSSEARPTCPCLFMWGKQKKIQFHGRRWVKELQARDGCDAIQVDGSHWFFWEEPDFVNAKIEEFIQSNKANL